MEGKCSSDFQKYSPPGRLTVQTSWVYTGGRPRGRRKLHYSVLNSQQQTHLHSEILEAKQGGARHHCFTTSQEDWRKQSCLWGQQAEGAALGLSWRETAETRFDSKSNSFKALAIDCGSCTIADCLISSLRIELCSRTVPHPQILQC